MKLQKTERLRLRGDLTIIQRNELTGRETRLTVRNQITYEGLNSALHSWSGGAATPSDYWIAQLVPGTNGTPPTAGDTGCYAPVAGGEIILTNPDRIVSPSTGELTITATLPKISAANGSTLREVALMLGNGDAFARQVHSPLDKTVSFTLTYIWIIALTT